MAWLRNLLAALFAFGASWTVAIGYWRANNRMPATADLVLLLLVLPLGLLLAFWLGRKLWRRISAPAALAAPAPAAVSAQTPAPVPTTAALTVLATALRSPHGMSAAALYPVLATRQGRPGLDAELVDDEGYPIMSARIADADPTAAREAMTTWLATSSLPTPRYSDEQWRALANGSAVVTDLGDELGHALPQLATPPTLQLLPVWQAGWTQQQRHAATLWFSHLLTNSGWPQEHIAAPTQAAAVPSAGADAYARPDTSASAANHADTAANANSGAAATTTATAATAATTASATAAAHPGDADAAEGDVAAVLARLLAMRTATPPARAGKDAPHNNGRLALVMACGSLIGEASIDALASDGALFTSRHPQGQMPGEGAAALLLADAGVAAQWPAAAHDTEPMAELRAVASALRPVSADAAKRADSATLRAASTQALAAAGCAASRVTLVAADTDHRGSRVMEMMGLLSDELPQLDAGDDLLSVGAACGSCGAVTHLTALALAAHAAVERDGAVLCVVNQDPYRRSAAVLLPASAISPTASAEPPSLL